MTIISARMDARGGVVLPVTVLEHLRLKDGRLWFVTEPDGVVRLVAADAIRDAVWANNRGFADGSAVDSRRPPRPGYEGEGALPTVLSDDVDARDEGQIVSDLLSQLI